MILRRLEIGSFAGLADRTFDFTDGLNILSGPNEAGKSTVFNALYHTLFTPSRVNKKQFDRELSSFLPLSGGDTIYTSLVFEKEGRYTLERSWGGEKRDILRLPDGGVLRNAEALSARLRELFPLSEGSLKNILLVSQNRLQQTLEELRSAPETGEEVGSMIRKSLFETGGLSVDRFRRLLEDRLNEYAARWDFDRERPERDKGKERGIDNPWKSGTGTIVKLWYGWRSLEAERDRAARLETERAALMEEFSSTEKELGRIKAYLAEWKRVFDAMKTMETLVVRYDRACELRDRHQAAIESWARVETEIKADRREIKRLDGELEGLEAEKKEAKKAEQIRVRKERYDELKILKAEMDKAEEELSSTPKVETDMVERIRTLDREAEGLKNRLSAGDLRLVLRGKTETALTVTTGTNESQDIRLEPGGREVIEAGTCAEIDTEDFSLSVAAGDIDVNTIRAGYKDSINHMEELLGECGVSTVQEAERAAFNRATLKNRLEQSRGRFKDALKGEDFDELAAAVDTPVEKRTRTLEEISGETTLRTVARAEAAGRLKQREEELKDLETAYGDRQGAVRVFSEAAVKAENLSKEVEGCGGVPEGFRTPADFISDYSEKEEQRRTLEEEWFRFKGRLLELDKGLPDESEEELEGRCIDAKKEFEVALRRGRHLAAIREKTEGILETLDKDTYRIYARRCAEYIDCLTSGAYNHVDLDDGLPSGIRGEGFLVPFPLLSSGTKDIFALAVRLSAADILLGERKGFLVLDDPLVDLDPERRTNAAACIEGWASENQVILFTCHNEHIELFHSPSVIEISRLDYKNSILHNDTTEEV